jgi:hypothetical protein
VAALLLQQKREEERLKALAEGTTPQGREILRKILWRTERLLNRGDHTLNETIATIQDEAGCFKILWPEFARLLSRLWGGKESGWLQTSPRIFAKLVVLRTTLALKAKAEWRLSASCSAGGDVRLRRPLNPSSPSL